MPLPAFTNTIGFSVYTKLSATKRGLLAWVAQVLRLASIVFSLYGFTFELHVDMLVSAHFIYWLCRGSPRSSSLPRSARSIESVGGTVS
jgi:hypothetical protein